MGLRPIILAAALPAAAALISGCGGASARDTHEYRYPSPDRTTAIVVSPEGRQRAARERRNAVYLIVASSEVVGSPPKGRAPLGSFQGLWAPGAIAWLDEVTVNVCPLEGHRAVPNTVSVGIGDTERRTFRITTDCPDFLRKAAGQPGPPKGS